MKAKDYYKSPQIIVILTMYPKYKYGKIDIGNKIDKFIKNYDTEDLPIIRLTFGSMIIINFVMLASPLYFYIDRTYLDREIFQNCDNPKYQSVCCDHVDPIGINLTNLINSFGLISLFFFLFSIVSQIYRHYGKNNKIIFFLFFISLLNFIILPIYSILFAVVLFRSNRDCLKNKKLHTAASIALFELSNLILFDAYIIYSIKTTISDINEKKKNFV